MEAVRCQSAEMARAWCIARVAIGTSEKGGWQRVAGPKRPLSYVGRSLSQSHRCISIIYIPPFLYTYISNSRQPKTRRIHHQALHKGGGEEPPRMNRWKMKCTYRTPDAVVEHREPRCAERLSKYKPCPNAGLFSLASRSEGGGEGTELTEFMSLEDTQQVQSRNSIPSPIGFS